MDWDKRQEFGNEIDQRNPAFSLFKSKALKEKRQTFRKKETIVALFGNKTILNMDAKLLTP